MNRRRMLSSIHRDIARHAGAPTMIPSRTVAQLSIAQLDLAGAGLLPARIVCPDCAGSGETDQLVTDDIWRMLPCRECGGRGYYQEEQL